MKYMSLLALAATTLMTGAIDATAQGSSRMIPSVCFIEVDGRIFLQGNCDADFSSDGSFSIGTGVNRRAAKHFAYVNIDPVTKKGRGSWNGEEAESHAHDDLGDMARQGGCWVNAKAKVCAWKR